MKIYKKLIVGIFLLLPMVIMAQNSRFMNSTPEERAQAHTEWMQKNLNLSNSQLDKIKPINIKYAHEMEKIKNSDMSNMEKIKVVKEVDKKRIAEFKTVLSSEQLKIYNDKKKELFQMIRKLRS